MRSNATRTVFYRKILTSPCKTRRPSLNMSIAINFQKNDYMRGKSNHYETVFS